MHSAALMIGYWPESSKICVSRKGAKKDTVRGQMRSLRGGGEAADFARGARLVVS